MIFYARGDETCKFEDMPASFHGNRYAYLVIDFPESLDREVIDRDGHVFHRYEDRCAWQMRILMRNPKAEELIALREHFRAIVKRMDDDPALNK